MEIRDKVLPEENFYRDTVVGLSSDQKSLQPKYFYNELGSQLFDQICELDEYYVTRTELGILTENATDIVSTLGKSTALLEYGSGAGVKIRKLLDAGDQIKTWVPMEICREHLGLSVERMGMDYPELNIVPVCTDYTKTFTIPELDDLGNSRIVFFPGSTLGNLEAKDAISLLKKARSLVQNDGGMLLGLDLVKEESVLLAAYNDSKGVTANFNLNILTRINDELNGNFDLEQFKHKAIFNPDKNRIEMHLFSLKDQKVSVGDKNFDFAEGESIHTESSHKYLLEDIPVMAETCGFELKKSWIDSKKYFGVFYLKAQSH